jgi:hypothetical protein
MCETTKANTGKTSEGNWKELVQQMYNDDEDEDVFNSPKPELPITLTNKELLIPIPSAPLPLSGMEPSQAVLIRSLSPIVTLKVFFLLFF